jgi:hypothetical protein
MRGTVLEQNEEQRKGRLKSLQTAAALDSHFGKVT